MASSSSATNPNMKDQELIDVVFSWSIGDALNVDLYKNKVDKIPETFSSTAHYTMSFVAPLLEETHAALLSKMKAISRASSRGITIQPKTTQDVNLPRYYIYNINLERKRTSENYEPEVGDLIALTNGKPRSTNDLNRQLHGSPCIIALVQRVKNEVHDTVQVISSKPIVFHGKESNNVGKFRFFAIQLVNLTTNIRIWKALHSKLDGKNMKIIDKVLKNDSKGDEKCTSCSIEYAKKSASLNLNEAMSTLNLNQSQETAVWSCIAARECDHQETVNLIWGPPGTGKTKTVGCLLFALWKMKCRTLTCAPTNNAVLEVASRFVSLVTTSLEYDTYGLGDIVLFGNSRRMKIGGFQELHQVFLEYRVSVLAGCLSPSFGWRSTAKSMIRLLRRPREEYSTYVCEAKKKDDEDNRLENFGIRSRSTTSESIVTKGKVFLNMKSEGKPLSFAEFITKRFNVFEEKLTTMFRNLYTHMPTSFVTLQLAKKMVQVITLIQVVGRDGLTNVFQRVDIDKSLPEFKVMRKEVLQVLEEVLCETESFPKFEDDQEIGKFCLEKACLIFCTASSSIRLHALETNVELLVVDEAAQLRECESVIPLQLSGLRDVILIGDEKQLPATVQSEICKQNEFGRSLFERLVSLKHTTQLLDVQYRMHPMISSFPNKEFYDKKIRDGPNVENRSYNKQFLEGRMFGSYSFIHLTHGKVEFDQTKSGKNMVEVAVIVNLVAKLHEESVAKKQKISVGCITPYKAQVSAIQRKLGDVYGSGKGDFCVNVRTVDGFQGCEEDVIIISTVTGIGNGSVGFLSTPQRANVALTRARHCLWILGNGDTLIRSSPIWERLIADAKARCCFHVANKDKSLARVITNSLIDSGQFDGLLDLNSLLFKMAKWKVIFDHDFLKSISNMNNPENNNEILSLLMQLSGGHRFHETKEVIRDSAFVKQYQVNCKGLSLVWSIDILEENMQIIQILKVWDILQGTSKVQHVIQRVDKFYRDYSAEILDRCKEKCYDGNLEVPKVWSKVTENECLSNQIAAMSLINKAGSSSLSRKNQWTRKF